MLEFAASRNYGDRHLEKSVRKCLLLTDLGEIEGHLGNADEALYCWGQSVQCQATLPSPFDYNFYLLLSCAERGLGLESVSAKFLASVDAMIAGQVRLVATESARLERLFSEQRSPAMEYVVERLAAAYLP